MTLPLHFPQTNSSSFYNNDSIVLNQTVCSRLMDSCVDFIEDSNNMDSFMNFTDINNAINAMNSSYQTLLQYEN
jgi:hypothetical protein